LKILLGNFKDKSDELVTFLEQRVGTKPKLDGGAIEIEDEGIRAGVKPRHVKTYLKRFLFKAGERKRYRVLVQGRELRIVELEGVEEEEEKKEGKQAEEPAKKEATEEAENKKEVKSEKAEEKEATSEEKVTEEKQKKQPRKRKPSGESS